MTYAGSLAWLDSLGEFHMALGLDRVQALLQALGNPQGAAPSIHVAGTNGKGATAAFCASILRTAGKRAGLYTSPHLSRPNERISIGGKPLSDDAFASAVTAVREAASPIGIDLTFFEVLTAAAFVAFREAKVDAMAIEVGLGGRLDATNVLDPAVSVITHLSRDHAAVLGDTIEAIAGEKAAIVKPGRPAVCVARDPRAAWVVGERAEKVGAPLYLIDRDLRWVERAAADAPPDGFVIETTAPAPALFVPRCRVPMVGIHHRDNAVAAALAVRIAFPEIAGPAMSDGIAAAKWPGRGERVLAVDESGAGPELVFDGAHNPGAAEALANALEGGKRKIAIVFAAMADKEHAPIFESLARLAPVAVVITSVGSSRSAAPAALAEAARPQFAEPTRVSIVEKPEEALAAARREAGAGGRVLVTGSLYLVGRLREKLLGMPETIG